VTVKAPFAGQPISSSQWLQPVAAAINRLEGNRAKGQIPSAAAPPSGSLVESGALVAEQTNTITVTRDSDSRVVTVAKPPNLRGNIGTRINGNGDTEEIFRAYHPGDVIILGDVINTGVSGVTLADLNWAARRWTIDT